MIEILISKGVDINVKDSNSYNTITLWLITIISKKERKYNNQNQTTLHIGAQTKWRKEIMKLLISKGANINAFDIKFKSLITIWLINIIFVKIRKLNNMNKTPLHIAAENCSEEIGELLISTGADINAKDIYYLYPKTIFGLRYVIF